MTPSPDPLDNLLEKMRDATPEHPGSVTRDVWRRISDAEAVASRPSILERIELAFGRPAFAVAFVVACVACGLFLAELRLTRQHDAENAIIEQEYLRLIAPLIAEAPPTKAANEEVTP